MKTRRVAVLVLADTIIISLAFFLSLYTRFDSIFYDGYLDFYFSRVVPVTLVKLAIFYLFNFYRSLWEFASIDELIEIFFGVFVANVVTMLMIMLTGNQLPISMFLSIGLFELTLIGGVRFAYRSIRRLKSGFMKSKGMKRVMIVGAGAAGVMILKELRNHDSLAIEPVAFIDDSKEKKGRSINGIRVVGGRESIKDAVEELKVDEIIIALPSASNEDRKEIINICKNTRAKTRILPGMYELIGGQVSISHIRDVQIEDLLGRDEVKLNLEELTGFVEGKIVMITGGGGSIGSELARQIIKYNPKKLILVDVYENSLYDFQQELRRNTYALDFEAIILSVRDKLAIDRAFERLRPEIVFHAAAHKHVPLMERSPDEAIKNNVFGTLNVVRASDKYKAEKFVLVSTDKAVNPTNVMGASKRVAEKIVRAYNDVSKTDFVAVRFGNVLGSNGSVIPLFKKQISEGGPVTVTDTRVIRYFMTIPEACQLVLQAGAMANGGEIFVLDMGEPVKIIDLATDLIKLSGYEPHKDIPIDIVGLRPGEKLYEELLIKSPDIEQTKHEKIYIEGTERCRFDEIIDMVDGLRKYLDRDDSESLKGYLASFVEGYTPYKK
jgi:FlaA1/EpsC-like NDP-sugar epimerase